MKKDLRNSRMYLEDMNLAMERIAEYIDNYSFTKFTQDQKTIDAVIRNFEVIGEASKNIAYEMKEVYMEIPWNEMYSLRNRVTHEYFGIDYEIIWDIASNYLPENKIQIEKILNELNEHFT